MLTPQMQLDLAPAVDRGPVIVELGICGDDARVETLHTSVPGCKYGYARVELAQHENGRWMWGLSYQTTWAGGGYRVGPKWGRFAPDRGSALVEALTELAARHVPEEVVRALVEQGRRVAA